MKYTCELCGFIYDEETGDPTRKIAPGTAFADLPDDFTCPGCGSEKEAFSPSGQRQSIQPPQEGRSWQYVKYSDHNGESDR